MNMVSENNELRPADSSGAADFSRRLVDRIKHDHIRPRPRWYFWIKDALIFASGLAVLVIGAANVAVMAYLFQHNDWDLRQAATGMNLWQYFVLTLPYFWLLSLAFFLAALYISVRRTWRGYRYPIWLTVLATVLASAILGSVFYLVGWGEKLDYLLGARVPYYDNLLNPHVEFWASPAEGRLLGVVGAQNGATEYQIIDLEGVSWRVTLSDESARETAIIVGQPVAVIGRVVAGDQFQASYIRRLRAGRGFIGRPLESGGRFICSEGGCFLPLPLPQGWAPGTSSPEASLLPGMVPDLREKLPLVEPEEGR